MESNLKPPAALGPALRGCLASTREPRPREVNLSDAQWPKSMASFGVPPRYVGASISDFSADVVDQIGDVQEEEGYLVIGPIGTGRLNRAVSNNRSTPSTGNLSGLIGSRNG